MVHRLILFITISAISANIYAQSFLHVEGFDMVDESGSKVLLRGVGLGNWMLPEGYMWKFGNEGDRPRKIEAIVAAHLGEAKAEQFWTTFRRNYITEADVRRISELGFNSLRPALNSRLFVSETKPHKWHDEGFELLDNLIRWCKTYGVYVIIDMHGAPGGQTGQNIDDSPNNLPELFSDPENQDLLVELWVRIAGRYADEPIVAAYDLLNEPLPENTGAAEKHRSQLVPLYQRLIKEIRQVDKRHAFTLEGYNWSNNWSLFDRALDDNMFYQFHYYCWDRPDNLNSISGFIDQRQKLQTPVWVGETGEKNSKIYFATTQYFERHNIGWSLWPWKKMDTSNTPYSIKPPAGWQAVAEYSKTGKGELAPDAERIFNELLENLKIENCVFYEDVVNAVFRRLPLLIEAENYGHDGEGVSYFVNDQQAKSKYYRKSEPVIIEQGGGERGGAQVVVLTAGEWTAYNINSTESRSYSIKLRIKGEGKIEFSVNGVVESAEISSAQLSEVSIPQQKFNSGENIIRIKVVSGNVQIDWIDIKN